VVFLPNFFVAPSACSRAVVFLQLGRVAQSRLELGQKSSQIHSLASRNFSKLKEILNFSSREMEHARMGAHIL